MMFRKTSTVVMTCVTLALIVSVIRADDQVPGAVEGPEAKADVLIEQLDDRRFSRRQDASKKLVELGEAAIAPLEQGAKSTSRERTKRCIVVLSELLRHEQQETRKVARAALERLSESSHALSSSLASEALDKTDSDTKPVGADHRERRFLFPRGPVPVRQNRMKFKFGTGGFQRLSVKQTLNGKVEINVKDSKREINIIEDPNQGIELRITEQKDGKKDTQIFQADDADALRKKNPQAYDLYKQYVEAASGEKVGDRGRANPNAANRRITVRDQLEDAVDDLEKTVKNPTDKKEFDQLLDDLRKINERITRGIDQKDDE